MGQPQLLLRARDRGDELIGDSVGLIRQHLLLQLRRNLGVGDDAPPAPCDDPQLAYMEPGSLPRIVHADLPAMLIGGIASLLLQMLHPLAMAGVSQHSRFREDPLGRLGSTARFVGITSFGSTTDAERAIELVRRIHRSVEGVTSDGRPYRASDPELLAWVHAAELQSFLAAHRVYGATALSEAEEDCYVEEMAKVARALGAEEVPLTVAALESYLDVMRPRLTLTREAKEARNFVIIGLRRWPHEAAAYTLLVAAAQGILPDWARRQLHLPALPASDRLVVRPAARVLADAMRWVVPAAHVAKVSPPSTTTTSPVT